MAKCSGISPVNWLLDKSRIWRRFILPNEEGMLPSKAFIEMLKDIKRGKISPISTGMWPWKLLLETSNSLKCLCE
ncbi:hypothetical protein CICLE_v10004060mg [Citrus x clementina]|uniref:Uncharacterized protein n=1 Tax=Citrus clementina TaxID=85681 RepID=V4V2J6_CITCL|nr:hypothetical protein CICLE_v10004060mg [Citrus x clementina]